MTIFTVVWMLYRVQSPTTTKSKCTHIALLFIW